MNRLLGRSSNAASTPCHMYFGISPTCPGVERKVMREVIPQPEEKDGQVDE